MDGSSHSVSWNHKQRCNYPREFRILLFICKVIHTGASNIYKSKLLMCWLPAETGESLDEHRKQWPVLISKTKTPQQLLSMWLGHTSAKQISSAQWGEWCNLGRFPVSLGCICSFQLQSLPIPPKKAESLHKLCFIVRNTSFSLW